MSISSNVDFIKSTFDEIDIVTYTYHIVYDCEYT